MHSRVILGRIADKAQQVVAEQGGIAPLHDERPVGVGFFRREHCGVGQRFLKIRLRESVGWVSLHQAFTVGLAEGGIAYGGKCRVGLLVALRFPFEARHLRSR